VMCFPLSFDVSLGESGIKLGDFDCLSFTTYAMDVSYAVCSYTAVVQLYAVSLSVFLFSYLYTLYL